MTNESDTEFADLSGEWWKPTPAERLSPVLEKIFVTVIAVMLFIGFPLWVVLDVGSTAFCRIYDCPINQTCDTP